MLLVVITFFLLSKREIQTYKKERVFWQEMESFACYFANELRFTCDEPLKILKRYALHNEVELPEQHFSLEQGVNRFFNEKVSKERVSELQEVSGFIGGLGTTDLEGQLAHCTRYARLFEQKVKTACELYETQGKLRQKLWILAGITAFLLLL